MTRGSLLLLAGALIALSLGACAHNGPRGFDDNRPPIRRGPAPAYADVAATYNDRVEHLDRVRAPLAIVLKSVGRDGRTINEQVEGHVQVERPRKLSLRIDKVSKTIFWLGSNEARFWWVDLTADPRTALIGTHEGVSHERAAELGLPVHPLDLIDLLGVTPLPGALPEHGSLAWTENGHFLRLDLPGRWGTTRLYLEPEGAHDPVSIELLDAGGEPAVAAILRDYQRVPVTGDALANARMATKIDAEIPASKTRLGLRLYDPENPGALKENAFRMEAVLAGYGVERRIDLDEGAPPEDGGGP